MTRFRILFYTLVVCAGMAAGCTPVDSMNSPISGHDATDGGQPVPLSPSAYPKYSATAGSIALDSTKVPR